MNNIYTIIIYCILLFETNVSLFSQSKPSEIHLKIIQTTDVHGAIFPFDYIRNQSKDYSLASVSTYVKSERLKDNQELILLDNGDILQGQPIVYFSNFEEPESIHICAAAMNYMKYDAGTVGNHDIEAGHAVYDKINKEFNFPWLAANAIDKKKATPYFKPYTIIEKKGLKIAVLGLITPTIPKWLPEKIWSGIEFEDMIESARKWAEFITKNERPDLLIGLFHSGIDYTYDNENESTYKNENASKLIAIKVPGFDIIFTGHDHKKYNQSIISENGSNVLILNAASNAQYMAVADIDLKWNKVLDSYEKSINGQLIDSKEYPSDTVFLNMLSVYEKKVDSFINRKIGNNLKTFSSRESIFGNSEFIDLIQKIQLDISRAEISFAAPLNYDYQINEGTITMRDMFKLYRFENLLYSMVLSGQEIKDFLEFSYNLWFNKMSSPIEPMLKYHLNETGKYILDNPYYYFSSAAGINYTVDISKSFGQRIKILNLSNGKKFKMNKKYKVAINSYTGNGGGGHLTKGSKIKYEDLPGRIVFSTDKDLRYYMTRYIEKTGTVNPVRNDNWKVIPEEWWKLAKEKEMKLLFP